MLKQLAKDSVIYGMSSAFSRGAQLVLVLIYTRYFSAVTLGEFELFNIIGMFFILFASFELSQALARFMADADSEEAKKEYISTAAISVALGFLLLFIIMLVAWKLGLVLWLWPRIDNTFLMLVLLAFTFNGIYLFLLEIFRWLFKPLMYLFCSSVFGFFYVSVSLYLVVVQDMKLFGAYVGLLMASLLSLILVLFFLKDYVCIVFSKKYFFEMLRFSAPLVISTLAVLLNLYVDRYIVVEYLGMEQLGIYSVVLKLASIVSVIAVSFQAALVPLIYKNYREGDISKNVGKIFNLYCAVVLIMVFLFAGLLDYGLINLVGSDFHAALPYVFLMMLVFLISSLYMFFPGLFLGKKTKVVMAVYIVCVGLNYLIGVLLVDQFGLAAVATGSLVAALFLFVSFVSLGQRYFCVKIRLPLVLSMFLPMVLLAYASALGYLNMLNTSWIILGVVFSILSLSFVYNGAQFYTLIRDRNSNE